MFSSSRLKELKERKRVLLAQADLHRELIGLESLQLRQRRDAAQAFADRHRWWLYGGAALGGLLLAGKYRGLARLLPAALVLVRALRS